MIFQWQLFAVLIAVAFLANMFGMKYRVNSFGQTEQRYKLIPALAVAIPLIYMAGTRGDSIGDTYAYRESFKNMPSSISAIAGYLTEDMKDKGFVAFSIILKSIIGNRDVIYFTIIATLCVLCVTLTFRKYSSNFFLSMFLFLASGDYIQWTFNGMRQFIAASVLFACIGLVIKKKYVPAIIMILLVSTIHASALIMIPVIFIVQGKAWNKKTVLLVLATILAIAFTDQFTDLLTNIMENTQYKSEVDQFLNTQGTNMLRVMVFSIPAIISLIFNNRIRMVNNTLINVSVGMSITTMAVYLASAFTSGIFIGRIPIYFSLYNYILLPWEIDNIFTKESARMLYVLMIALYGIFYYYQVVVTWGL